MLSAWQPTEKQGKTDTKLAKIQSITSKDSTKGKMLLISNPLGTTAMTRLGFCTLPRADQILWCLIAQLCSHCSFYNWGGMVGLSPAQHTIGVAHRALWVYSFES